MTEPQDTWDPPQDTGAPDTTETDAAALNSAEDLDEDRLRTDPLDEGMDPPEHWSGVDKYGMTPREERNPRPLGERLDEEQPDIPDPAVEHRAAESEAISITGGPGEIPPAPDEYEEELGIEADIAGGSMADEIREPEPPE
ncbi:hypothetical protein [Nocardia brevicatena]|uniref:hypothetical protein n=1 Tax=Nocardia brevicatena TaxID=37327 RepID=UPI0002F72973|nr:hypothetical protein [Nocardia brevicatena]